MQLSIVGTDTTQGSIIVSSSAAELRSLPEIRFASSTQQLVLGASTIVGLYAESRYYQPFIETGRIVCRSLLATNLIETIEAAPCASRNIGDLCC